MPKGIVISHEADDHVKGGRDSLETWERTLDLEKHLRLDRERTRPAAMFGQEAQTLVSWMRSSYRSPDVFEE